MLVFLPSKCINPLLGDTAGHIYVFRNGNVVTRLKDYSVLVAGDAVLRKYTFTAGWAGGPI